MRRTESNIQPRAWDRSDFAKIDVSAPFWSIEYQLSAPVMWGCILVLLFTLISAISIDFIGRLFIGDILVLSLACVGGLSLLREGQGLLTGSVFSLLLFIGMASLLDLLNEIPREDLYRGGARNTVFVAAVIAGVQLPRWFGLRRALALILLVALAPTWAGLIEPQGDRSFSEYVKFMGAGRVVQLAILYVSFPWLQVLILIVASSVTAILLDSRAGGALGFATVVVFFIRGVIRRMRWSTFLLLSLAGATVFVPIAINLLTIRNEGDWRASRHELSNSQRYYMALSAWEGIKARPITGNGSWQHARTYVDETIRDVYDAAGVHSYILQFGYEYGVLGLVLGAFIGVLGILGCWKFCRIYKMRGVTSGCVIVGCLLSLGIVYATLFSPFSGYTRITGGLICGVLLTSLTIPVRADFWRGRQAGSNMNLR